MAKELSNRIFDYSIFDDDTKRKLIWYAAEIRKHYARHAEEALAMGKMLIESKELCGESPFSEWAPIECGCSLRTAYKYISIYSEFSDCAHCAHIELSAMYELTKSKSAKKKALSLAAKGIQVTYSVARDLVQSVLGSSSDKGKPGGVSSSSSTSTPASPGPASGEALDSPASGPGHGAETQHQAADRPDAHPSAGESGDPFDEANEEEPWGNEREEEPGAESPPKQREPGIVAKTGREAKVWEAQQVLKQWSDAVGRWMNGNPAGIDAYREEFPGPLGDRVIDAAKELYNSFVAWKKGLK